MSTNQTSRYGSSCQHLQRIVTALVVVAFRLQRRRSKQLTIDRVVGVGDNPVVPKGSLDEIIK